MTRDEMDNLRVGDVIEHTPSGICFKVYKDTRRNTFVHVQHPVSGNITATKPAFAHSWELVKKAEPVKYKQHPIEELAKRLSHYVHTHMME